MGYVVGLTAVLTALWLGLSGYFDKPILLFFGVVSVTLSVVLTARMGILDRDASPYLRFHRILAYLPWLVGEILKANAKVLRACLAANLDIRPTLVKVKTGCRSDLAKTIFANSITLTPGTVTVDVDGDMLLVHGLYEEDSQPEAFEEMDRRVVDAVDGKARRSAR